MRYKFIIWLLILGCLFLLLFGCTEKVNNKLEENPKGNLEGNTDGNSELAIKYPNPPMVMISFSNEGNYYSYDLPLDSTVVYTGGEHVSLFLRFDEPIKEDSFIKYIKILENEKINIYSYGDYKAFELSFSNVNKGDSINFTINKELENINGLQLKEDMSFNYIVEEAIEASFTIYGEDYNLYYPKGNNPPVFYEEDQLTNLDKVIKIIFSGDVDKGLVEEVLKKNAFRKEDIYNFQWSDSKTLYIHIDKLTNDRYIFDIFSYKTPIINKIHFSTNDANILYSYSFEDNILYEERLFKDYRYDFNRNSSIKDYLFMADNNKSYIYSFIEDNVAQLSEVKLPHYLGMGPWHQEVLWINSDVALYLDTNVFYTYDFSTKVKEELFSIDKDIDNLSRVFEFVISPDKKNIAVAIGTEDYDNNRCLARISVYKLTGEKLYQGPIIEDIRTSWGAGVIFYLNMGWLSDTELLHEAVIGEEQYGVAITDIRKDTTRVIIENATGPHTSPNTGVVIAKQGGNHIIRSNYGERIMPLDGISDIYIKDEKTILYTREKSSITQLISMNLATGEDELLGEMPGSDVKFLGVSHNNDKIYLVSNKHFLLVIT